MASTTPIKVEGTPTSEVSRVDTLPSVDTVTHKVHEHIDRSICIRVGSGTNVKEFDIHRGLLQFYSGYFRTAIQNIDDGKFAEAKSGVIELPDEVVVVFEVFKQWLYAANRKLAKDNKADWTCFSFQDLFQLWCFAERRIIPMLQNRAIDLTISKLLSSQGDMALKAVRYAYDHSLPGSHLRRIIIFNHAQVNNVNAMKINIEEEVEKRWFQDWATDVAIERLKQFGNAKPLKNRCSYHQHEPSVQCSDKSWRVYN